MNYNVEDLTGRKFDRWTVLFRAPNNKDNDAMWMCRCICGTTRIVRGVVLRSGQSRSCGCYQKECARKLKALADGEGAFRQLFRVYKNMAKRRGISFRLSRKAFRKITKGNCHYCGTAPAQGVKRRMKRGKPWGTVYIYNGVDRLDSSKGYVKDNCVPCCGTHNLMKLDMSVSEFLEACRSVVRQHGEK